MTTFLILTAYLISCFAFAVAFFAHSRARRAERQARATADLTARFMRATNRRDAANLAAQVNRDQQYQSQTDATWRDMEGIEA